MVARSKASKATAGLIGLALLGSSCIKRVYVTPEDEISYRQKFEACQKARKEAEADLSEAIDIIIDLSNCPE